MGAITDIGNLFVETLFYLVILAVLLRFILQWVRADFYNPISQALVKATQPVLKPLRRFIPGLFGLDMAALVLAAIISVLGSILLITLAGYKLPPILLLLGWGVISVLYNIANIFFFALIAFVIVSWVAPGNYSPAILLLNQIVEPICAPFRKLIPPLGGLDLSPILVFFAINIVKILLSSMAAKLSMSPAFVIGM